MFINLSSLLIKTAVWTWVYLLIIDKVLSAVLPVFPLSAPFSGAVFLCQFGSSISSSPLYQKPG